MALILLPVISFWALTGLAYYLSPYGSAGTIMKLPFWHRSLFKVLAWLPVPLVLGFMTFIKLFIQHPPHDAIRFSIVLLLLLATGYGTVCSLAHSQSRNIYYVLFTFNVIAGGLSSIFFAVVLLAML